jgi:hypothetical protein
MIEHAFTKKIREILAESYGSDAETILEKSLLIQYLNLKTKSANKGSKSRGSFGNNYAIYVLVEDYIKHGFHLGRKNYRVYEGANFSELFARQRELPFGRKLQNHHLNNRCNDEFRKFFPGADHVPIIRDLQTRKYWFNEKLLNLNIGNGRTVNLAEVIIKVIDAYSLAKKSAFESFIEACKRLRDIDPGRKEEAASFIANQLKPNVDARVFEIISFSILKAYYADQSIYWGWSKTQLNKESLILFKTGRTNANDGGIDFVMRPLGRFFQVTETVDTRKYFLDIDKLQKYPITFVVKTDESSDVIRRNIREQAASAYGVDAIVDRYMSCIEEIINVPDLLKHFDSLIRGGKLDDVMAEVVRQSIVEFNYDASSPSESMGEIEDDDTDDEVDD